VSDLRVSIVIPARDEEGHLARVLPACLEAARRVPGGAEVIVSDHGSTDGTTTLARRLGARVVDATGAPTIAAVRNRGARAAEGEILAFLDADCVPEPEWLVAAVRLFAEEPGTGAAGLPPRSAPGEGWIARASARFAGAARPGARARARWLPSANLIVRRATFERVHGFDEALATCEDYDLTVRIRAAGEELALDPGLGATHLREPGSIGALFQKERWRGRASIAGVKRHGLVPAEIPSIVLPFLHAALALSLLAAILSGDLASTLVALALLLAPSLALALRAALRARSPGDLPALFAFACIYGAARTAALVPSRSKNP
jgi:glycosyltransferase involved in cell wall biosynthesis